MLPCAGPSAGFEYLFDRIGITCHEYLHPRNLITGLSRFFVLCHRAYQCDRNMAAAIKNPKPDISPYHDLGPHELERVCKWYEWTKDWDFMFSVRSRGLDADEKRWMADGTLFFKGLSPADCDAIP